MEADSLRNVENARPGHGSLSGSAKAQDRKWREFVARARREPGIGFQEHLAAFRTIFAHRKRQDGPPPVWHPSREAVRQSNLRKLISVMDFESLPELHRWSVTNREAFWTEVVRRLGIRFREAPDRILGRRDDPLDPGWMTGGTLNISESCFQAPPERTAILSGREGSRALRATTYRELNSLVDRVANGLRDLDLGPGHGVALYMPMTMECVAAYLGILRAGCHVVSIADSFTPAEIRKRLEVAEAKAIVTVAQFPRSGRQIKLYEKVKEAEGPPAVVLCESSMESSELRPGDMEWSQFLGSDEPAPPHVARPYDTVNVLFSSGTTGEPKGIPWTHLTPIKCAADGHFHLDIGTEDVVAWPTNIGWMMGPWLIFATLVNGATMALFEGAPRGAGFAAFIEDAGVSILGTVPTLVRGWRSSGAQADADWSRIRLFASTGEASNQEEYLWLMSLAAYRAPIIEYCGGTEIGGAYLTGSVLQPASPGTFTTPALGLDLVLISGKDEGVEEGESGEVHLIPPSIGLSETLLNADHDRVYHAGCPPGPGGAVLRRHGDRMRRLARGFYVAEGRADDTMNLGGIKVGSVQIEEVLNADEAVLECVAVGIPKRGGGGEDLAVFVVPADPAGTTIDLRRRLQHRLSSELNPLFRIRKVIPVKELPRTASGKLMRRVLRERAADRA